MDNFFLTLVFKTITLIKIMQLNVNKANMISVIKDMLDDRY
jgi:hypothetical protein